jgi:hypothetical protein
VNVDVVELVSVLVSSTRSMLLIDCAVEDVIDPVFFNDSLTSFPPPQAQHTV